MKLKALILNCTLKPSGQPSNTEALLNKAISIFQSNSVECEVYRIVDLNIKPGTDSDMGEGDDWPVILNKIKESDILLIGAPIWVGHTCSLVQRLFERLDAVFHEEELWHPVTGQYYTYNKVAGVAITGNEDGAHHVSSHVLWALQEFGFTIPPNVNSYWVGEAGGEPSYIEAGGSKKLYPNKTIRFTVHNLIYFAQLLKNNPIPTNLNKLTEEAQKESEQ